MRHHRALSVLVVSVLLSLPCTSTVAQLRGGVGGARSSGAGIAEATARGLSSPRSGLGFRSNPIANPAPSLTPHEVLNPRGSLSAGQVLNPKPSLNRPRSGGAFPVKTTGNPTTAVRYQSARPIVDDGETSGDAVPRAIAPTPRVVPAGERILEAVVALDRKVSEVAPNKGWAERLSTDQLRIVPVFSEQPENDDQRTALEKILKTYQAVAQEDQSAVVNLLPEFKETIAALQEYLSPIEVRQRKKTAASFQQLASDLRSYKNGAPWVDYLVPDEMTSTDSNVSMSQEQAEKVLKRFDKLAGNPDYKKVTSLPGFKPAHDALKAAVGAAKP